MAIRVTLSAALVVAILLTQTSCGGGGSRGGASGGGVKPLALPKLTPQSKPKTEVYFGDDMTVVKRAGRTYVKFRDDDNGDGIPDED